MTDYFALFGEPRRPAIDEERLKQKFFELSAACHPDRVHGADESAQAEAQQQFTELNAAYQCLLDPRDRLLHLIALESGTRAHEVQSIPSELMDLFITVGKLCRETDAFITEKESQTSPLLRVEMFERGHSKAEALITLRKQVEAWRESLLGEIRKLDSTWEAGDSASKPGLLNRLREIAGLLNYSKKWNAQMSERLVQLAV